MRYLKTFLPIAALALLCAVPAQADVILRQSTASQADKLGPFVDSTDGNTQETALTIANTDIKCSKNGGTLASKNSGGGTHDANGWYTVTWDATDTNTVGRFRCFVHVAGALAVTYEAQVVEEAVYDAFYGASALGYVANAPVNVAQFGGSNGTFASGRPEVNMTHIAGASVSTSSAQLGVNVVNLGGSAVSATSGVANVNVAQISTDSGAADTLETWLDGTTGPATPLGIGRQGTAQSATGTTLVLDAGASYADSVPNGMTLVACGSTQGYCQSRPVTGYVGSTDTATVDAWAVTPSGTITYTLFNTAPSSGGGGGSLTAAQVWSYSDRQLTALDEDVTTLDLNATATGAAASVTGAVGSVTGAVGSVTGNVGGNVTGSVGSVATGGITAASIATDAIGAAEVASDAVTEIQSGLATAAALNTVDDFVDTEVAAIKAKTDQLNFGVTGQVDANTESMNAQPVCGTGDAGTPWTGCP